MIASKFSSYRCATAQSFLLFMLIQSGNAQVFDVKNYGAKGDGITEDQAAFASAIAAIASAGGGTLYIPRGKYILTKDTTGGNVSARGTIEIDGVSNIKIVGEGWQNTILKLKPGDYRPIGDTHIFRIKNGSHYQIRDLTIDGSRDSVTVCDTVGNVITCNDQMHGLFLWNVSNALIEGVRFYRLRGDGVFVMGDGGITENVTVTNSRFFDNGRSGIANQGGIRQMSYTGNVFELTSDQDIDFEPTERPGPTDVIITGNLLKHSTGTIALTLGGETPCNPAKRFVVSQNIITGGGVLIRNIEALDFSDNEVVNNRSQRPFDIGSYAKNVRITGNYIEGSVTEEVVHVNASTAISDVIIAQNDIVQVSIGNEKKGIYIESAGDNISVLGNTVSGNGDGQGIHARIVSNDGITRHAYRVSDNTVKNFDTGIIFSSFSNATKFSGVMITENIVYTDRAIATQIIGIDLVSGGNSFIQHLRKKHNITIPGIIAPIMIPGNLLFYRDHTQDGTGDVANPSIIGQGSWNNFKFLFSGGSGVLYAVDPSSGNLLFYPTQNGTDNINVANSSVISSGNWNIFQFLFSGGKGIIYAVDPAGKLRFYKIKIDGTFDINTFTVIGTGLDWGAFRFLFHGGYFSGNGIIYAVNQAGELRFFLDTNPSGTGAVNVNPPALISETGWGSSFKFLFSGGNGVIYAVNQADELRFYRDTTQNGTGKVDVAPSPVIGKVVWNTFKFFFSCGNGIIYAVVK